MLTSLREIIRYRSLLRALVARELKVRYKRSFFGIAWTMLHPLMMMLVFTLVFAEILKVPVEHFTVFFMSAYLLWNFVAQTTSWSAGGLLGYAPLMRKVYVPKAVFVIATVVAGLVNLVVSLVPLAVLMLVVHHPMRPSLAFLPVSMLLAAVFALGISLLLAPLSILFADIVPIYQIVLTAWLYVTPVMYTVELVPARFRPLVDLNPMTYFVELFRAPIFHGHVPTLSTLGTASAFAFGALVLGWIVFDRYSDRVAYHV